MAANSSAGRGRTGAEGPAGTGVILFHGAGGDRDHPLFLALEAGLGSPVARVNFPYRDRGPGRRPPDRMPRLVEAVAEASAHWAHQWGLAPDRLVLGGRSLGGRAASLAVAEAVAPARGLLLLSYPLHPPGQPGSLRVDHLGQLACPVLLIQGDRDPFGTPAEFARHFPALGGPVAEMWLPGGHDPARRHDQLIVETVAAWLEDLAPAPTRGRSRR